MPPFVFFSVYNMHEIDAPLIDPRPEDITQIARWAGALGDLATSNFKLQYQYSVVRYHVCFFATLLFHRNGSTGCICIMRARKWTSRFWHGALPVENDSTSSCCLGLWIAISVCVREK